MRRNPRPPYALAPLLIVLAGTCYWIMTSSYARTGLNFGWRGDRPADRMAMAAAIAAGVASQNAGDVHGAADQFQDAVTAGGGSSRAYVDVAQDLISRDLPPAAAKLLESASKQPDYKWDPMLWATLADAYTDVGDVSKATDAAKQAREAASALESQEGAKPANPNDARALAGRLREVGRYYRESKDTDKARAMAALRAALTISPDDPKTQTALGYALTQDGSTPKDLKEAVELTQKAVQRETDDNVGLDSESLDAYGWALFRSGDPVGARRVLSTGLEVDPDSAMLHFHMAKVYAAANDLFDAALELDRAILLQPNFADAKDARKALPSPLPTPLPLTSPPPAGAALSTGLAVSPPPAPASAAPSAVTVPRAVTDHPDATMAGTGTAAPTRAPDSGPGAVVNPGSVSPQPVRRPTF